MARLLAALMALAAALRPGAARAHPAQFTTLQVTVEATGRFHASLNIDILAYALGETSLGSTNEELQAVLDGPRDELARKLADAGSRFRQEVVIRTDAGRVIPSAWDLPGLAEVNAVLARKIQPPILMPGEIDFSGTLPLTARRLAIRLPYVLGDTMQVFELPNGDSNAAPVAAGAFSSDIPLVFSAPAPAPIPAVLPPETKPALTGAIKALACTLLVVAIFLLGSRLAPLLRKTPSPPAS